MQNDVMRPAHTPSTPCDVKEIQVPGLLAFQWARKSGVCGVSFLRPEQFQPRCRFAVLSAALTSLASPLGPRCIVFRGIKLSERNGLQRFTARICHLRLRRVVQFVRHILRRMPSRGTCRGRWAKRAAESRRCAIDLPGQASPSEANDVAVSGVRRGEWMVLVISCFESVLKICLYIASWREQFHPLCWVHRTREDYLQIPVQNCLQCVDCKVLVLNEDRKSCNIYIFLYSSFTCREKAYSGHSLALVLCLVSFNSKNVFIVLHWHCYLCVFREYDPSSSPCWAVCSSISVSSCMRSESRRWHDICWCVHTDPRQHTGNLEVMLLLNL